MPRLLHMADVHLGARHDDLGPAAAAQRERQFDAFKRAIDLAIAEKVDLVLICGDLFDSNSQPRRSVERAAAELGRLVQRHIPAVIIPGTHDCYDAASIYRVFDLSAMAGAARRVESRDGADRQPGHSRLSADPGDRQGEDLPGQARRRESVARNLGAQQRPDRRRAQLADRHGPWLDGRARTLRRRRRELH